jgi:lysylphosphatidylglycerol synthetase-like protein (DUF2156 family)
MKVTRLRRFVAENQWIVVAIAALGLAYAALASTTRPFTDGAYVVTAVPLLAGVAVMALLTRTTRRSVSLMRSNRESNRDIRLNRWSLAWITMAMIIACWELYCYAGSPRSEHPTLSTLIDLLDSTRVGKALAFALWLALGCYLVLQ